MRLPSFVLITSLMIACAGEPCAAALPFLGGPKIASERNPHARVAESTVQLPQELSAVRLRRA